MGGFVLGLVGALIAVLGLFLASGAKDAGIYYVGFVFFLFGIGLDFWLIGRAGRKLAG